MGKFLTNDEFLQKINKLGIKHIPLEEYKGSKTKIKWMCYKNNKHIFYSTPNAIYKDVDRHVCPYCNRRKVFVGETDMWTTNPEIASMLKNKEDGYRYFATSSQRVDFICPKCNCVVKNKIINNVRMFGLSCDNCSDGMSFGEKFIANMLFQLSCDFIYDKTTKWSDCRRYDFRVPDKDLIIEAHGIQHYENSFTRYCNCDRKARTYHEEKKNDDYKMKLAFKNGIKHYVQIDCRYSDFNYIKNSIINSELSILFDLSHIDWGKCFQSTFNSNVVLCADLWMSGLKSTKDISKRIGMDITSVVSYLKKSAKIGLCDYVPNYTKNEISNENYCNICMFLEDGVVNVGDLAEKTGLSTSTVYKTLKKYNIYDYVKKSSYKKQRKRNGRIICIETQKIYNTNSELKNDGFNPKAVVNCCNGRSNTFAGLHWKII